MKNTNIIKTKENTIGRVNSKSKLLILLLCSVLLMGGIFAYFTDTETKDNKFTVGNVDIQLIEDKWDKHLDGNQNDIPDIAETITPLKSIDKDPLISNIGTNDAWVYLEVKIPLLKNVVVADVDGNKLPADDIELFSFVKNEGWTQLGVNELDATGENMVYVYGYNTALSSKQSTPTLFDTIKFANIIEGQGIEKTNQSVIVTAKAIQTDGTGTMTEAYDRHFKEGEVAGDQYREYTLKSGTLPYKDVATSVSFDKGIPDLTGKTYTDVSEFQDGSVIAYLDDSNGMHVVSDGTIAFNENSSFLFNSFSKVVSINFSNNINTSNVTNMEYMFSICLSLTSLDLSNFDTSNVKNMTHMFSNCRSLISLDISNFNTTNVNNMRYMFYMCNKLTTLDLSSFDTFNVINMTNMFYYCEVLISIKQNFDMTNVINKDYMFDHCGTSF